MSYAHDRFKEYKDKQAKAKHYKNPERELAAEKAKSSWQEAKREEKEDYDKGSKLLDWGSMD